MKPLVLVADDDLDSRAVARDALVMAGYDVVEAVDGVEALDLAESSHAVLVLLDLAMPRMDGWTAARRLRQGARPDIRIVAYTAHALLGDREKALAAGCDDYLAKPCTPQDVVRKADRWVRGGQGERP